MSVNFINLFFLRLFKGNRGVILLKRNGKSYLKEGGFKKRVEGDRFRTVLFVFIMSLLISVPLLTFSYYSNKISDLNRKIVVLNEKKKSYEQELNSLKVEYAKLTSPERLNRMIDRFGLRLANVDEIYYLSENGLNNSKLATNLKIHK